MCCSRTTWVERSLRVLVGRHGCNVSHGVLMCLINKNNGFTRQFGSASCYEPLTDEIPKNGFKGLHDISCIPSESKCRKDSQSVNSWNTCPPEHVRLSSVQHAFEPQLEYLEYRTPPTITFLPRQRKSITF
ncbi:hypothetical protein Y032_0089g2320 [Ancylostoma ceylanicum]|uniref:Uncharacterized protein n=1 Tax=Ancylostoma ceylanicum TaxID=53326 RepID=A0A016TP62_9BILA|nr:hypothetical protein Y032_0089g2320 [Ancylostoma ceylanicum]